MKTLTAFAFALCLIPALAQARVTELTDKQIIAAAVAYAESDSANHAYGSDDDRDTMEDVTHLLSEDAVSLMRVFVRESCMTGRLAKDKAAICDGDTRDLAFDGSQALVRVDHLDCAITYNFLAVDRRTGAVTYLFEATNE